MGGREGSIIFFFSFIIWCIGCISKSVITRLPVGGRDGKHFFFFFSFIIWCICCISKSVITRLPVGGRDGKHFFFFFIYYLVYWLYFEVGNYAASSGWEGREAFFFFFFFSFIIWCICCISMSITRRLIVGGEIRGANFNNNTMLLMLIVLY